MGESPILSGAGVYLAWYIGHRVGCSVGPGAGVSGPCARGLLRASLGRDCGPGLSLALGPALAASRGGLRRLPQPSLRKAGCLPPVSVHGDTSQLSSPACVCLLPSTGEVAGRLHGGRQGAHSGVALYPFL